MRTLCLLVACLWTTAGSAAEPFQLRLSYQQPASEEDGSYHRLQRSERWNPATTAIIVCDMWDAHHCYRAVLREQEFAPRLDALLVEARERGVTIIHAPSGCMEAYVDHPARHRATAVPQAPQLPAEIDAWCYQIPAEEQGTYPIDQSDGGEDDDPEEHARWAQQLQERGRDPKQPWQRQIELVQIDSEKDFVSDSGSEIWSILHARGIENVMLTGVHTNMCVLGRPFGLRQLARNGKNVVLVRDLTDTMYNPRAWPFVSHFTGTDLIIDHIERYVCPTITSDQILSNESEPFRFSADTRLHVVALVAEQEYKTAQTLPAFAVAQLGKEFRTSFVFAGSHERNDLPGLQAIEDADILLISVRRRTLPQKQLKMIRDWIATGRPVVGLRTASHAFSASGRDSSPAPGGGSPTADVLSEWPEFDAEVFGGNYSGHHANSLPAVVEQADGSGAVMADLQIEPFTAGGSLYRTSPLAKQARVLLVGRVQGHDAEPVAWTFRRSDGGYSFYTSLGHPDDFENPQFTALLTGALRWAAARQPVP